MSVFSSSVHSEVSSSDSGERAGGLRPMLPDGNGGFYGELSSFSEDSDILRSDVSDSISSKRFPCVAKFFLVCLVVVAISIGGGVTVWNAVREKSGAAYAYHNNIKKEKSSSKPSSSPGPKTENHPAGNEGSLPETPDLSGSEITTSAQPSEKHPAEGNDNPADGTEGEEDSFVTVATIEKETPLAVSATTDAKSGSNDDDLSVGVESSLTTDGDAGSSPSHDDVSSDKTEDVVEGRTGFRRWLPRVLTGASKQGMKEIWQKNTAKAQLQRLQEKLPSISKKQKQVARGICAVGVAVAVGCALAPATVGTAVATAGAPTGTAGAAAGLTTAVSQKALDGSQALAGSSWWSLALTQNFEGLGAQSEFSDPHELQSEFSDPHEFQSWEESSRKTMKKVKEELDSELKKPNRDRTERGQRVEELFAEWEKAIGSDPDSRAGMSNALKKQVETQSKKLDDKAAQIAGFVFAPELSVSDETELAVTKWAKSVIQGLDWETESVWNTDDPNWAPGFGQELDYRKQTQDGASAFQLLKEMALKEIEISTGELPVCRCISKLFKIVRRNASVWHRNAAAVPVSQ